MKSFRFILFATLTFVAILSCSGLTAEPAARCQMWIDDCTGEPTSYQQVLSDLSTADLIYLGERHTLMRHHDLQARIVRDLAAQKTPLVLGLEMMEKPNQAALDRYSRGEIDFDQLAKETDWKNRWHNFRDYKNILEAAKKAGAPILALNARAETIRKIARNGGVDKLDAETRQELPEDLVLDDPVYRQMLEPLMMGHMVATPESLRPMFEAQMSRDETMASTLCDFLKTSEGKGRKAIILCGAIHAAHGLGMPARVTRRLPEATERIVIFSDSGDVKLSPRERAMSRPVHTPREKLRKLNLRIADYLHVTAPKKAD